MYFRYTIFQGKECFNGTVKLSASRLGFAATNCFGFPCTTAFGYIKPIIKNFNDVITYKNKNCREKEEITTIFAFLALNDRFQIDKATSLGNKNFDFFNSQNPSSNFLCEIKLNQTGIFNTSQYSAYYNSDQNRLYLVKPISFGDLIFVQSMRK